MDGWDLIVYAGNLVIVHFLSFYLKQFYNSLARFKKKNNYQRHKMRIQNCGIISSKIMHLNFNYLLCFTKRKGYFDIFEISPSSPQRYLTPNQNVLVFLAKYSSFGLNAYYHSYNLSFYFTEVS